MYVYLDYSVCVTQLPSPADKYTTHWAYSNCSRPNTLKVREGNGCLMQHPKGRGWSCTLCLSEDERIHEWRENYASPTPCTVGGEGGGVFMSSGCMHLTSSLTPLYPLISGLTAVFIVNFRDNKKSIPNCLKNYVDIFCTNERKILQLKVTRWSAISDWW